jgi:very-short-patch-repair endonuclease
MTNVEDQESQAGARWRIDPALQRRMTLVARKLRRQGTRGEQVLWEELRDRRLQGRKFRRQQPVGPFVLDFYCKSERLTVEIDGPVHAEQVEADAERQRLLESLGLRFLRISDQQVLSDLDGVLATISAAFREAASPPTAKDGAPPPRLSERGSGGEEPT